MFSPLLTASVLTPSVHVHTAFVILLTSLWQINGFLLVGPLVLFKNSWNLFLHCLLCFKQTTWTPDAIPLVRRFHYSDFCTSESVKCCQYNKHIFFYLILRHIPQNKSLYTDIYEHLQDIFLQGSDIYRSTPLQQRPRDKSVNWWHIWLWLITL